MSSQILSLILVLGLISIEFFADIIVKKWTLHEVNNAWLILAFIVFISAFVLWTWAMKLETYSKVVNFYAILSIIGGVVTGYIFFQDKFSTTNIVGIILALVSVVLIAK